MTTVATIAAQLTLNSAQFTAGLATASRSADAFGSKMTGIGKGIVNATSNIGSAFTSMGSAITKNVTLPVLAVGAGFAAMGVAAVKVGSDFDTQMKNIQSISRQSDADIAMLAQEFLKMSSDLSQTTDTATKLAEGFYFIQSSGFAGADGMEVLKVATKAATAGLSDTSTASQAILATLNAYGLGASEAARVSDVLFKTVDVGVMTFGDLASQLGDVVNTAAITAQPIETVGAALATMTRKGVSSAESVTALNQLLLQFISPSKKMMDAAEEMGVELSLDALRTKGLQGALMDIEKIGGPNAMLTLFGDNVRALKGALTLTGDNAEEFNDILGAMGMAAGRTDEAFATQTQSIEAFGKNIKNVITNLGIGFAQSIKPHLTKFVGVISNFITKNKDKFARIFNLLSQSVKIVLDWLGKQVEKNGPKFIAFFDKLATIMPTILDNIGRAFDKVWPYVDDFFLALENGTAIDIGGWVTDLLGLAALGPIFTAIGTLFPLLVPWLLSLASGISTNGPAIIDFFTRVGEQLPLFLAKLEEIGTVVGPKLQEMFDAFMNADPDTILLILEAIGGIALLGPPLIIVGTAVSGISSAFGLLGSILTPFITWLGATAIPAIAAFVVANATWIVPLVIIIGLVWALYYVWKNNIGNIQVILYQLGGIVTYVFGNIIKKIGDTIKKIGELVTKFMSVKLPWWMTPGSPTPLELGLVGIQKAMAAISKTDMLPSLQSSIGVNATPGGMLADPTNLSSSPKGGATIVINNPVPEKSDVSIRKTLKNLAYLGVEL